MVGLRKACSLVLVAWVVFSPLMLSWHRALAHPHGSSFLSAQFQNGEACGAGSCTSSVGTDTSLGQTTTCPFGNDSRLLLSAGESSSNDDCCSHDCGGGTSERKHSCRICELLWHDDVVTVQWFFVMHSVQSVRAEPEESPRCVCFDVLYSWSVRGPPSMT
jgi:hypothetical protein